MQPAWSTAVGQRKVFPMQFEGFPDDMPSEPDEPFDDNAGSFDRDGFESDLEESGFDPAEFEDVLAPEALGEGEDYEEDLLGVGHLSTDEIDHSSLLEVPEPEA